jgi:hypothetical protein
MPATHVGYVAEEVTAAEGMKRQERTILLTDWNGKTRMMSSAATSTKELKLAMQDMLGILVEDQMISSPCSTLSFALMCDDSPFSPPEGIMVQIQVRARCLGGKGGFGAMLRGQQSRPGMKQVAPNTGAMRDLSGRRLRHVEQEQKLAEWAAESDKRKAEKELEKKEKRQKIWEETHKMAEEYVAEASISVENVQEAVIKGLEEDKKKRERSLAEQSAKKHSEKEAAKKLDKLWGDDDDDSSSSSDGENQAAKEGVRKEQCISANKHADAEKSASAPTAATPKVSTDESALAGQKSNQHGGVAGLASQKLDASKNDAHQPKQHSHEQTGKLAREVS